MKKIIFFTFLLFLITNNKVEAKYVGEFYDESNSPVVTVINYHHFGEKGTYQQIDNIRNSGEEFKAHLQILKDNGYTTITEQQLISYLKGKEIIPKKSVLITIDDGFKSVYEIAYPILKEMNMNAVFFPITAELDRGYRKGVPMVTYKELNEMVQSGHIEVGNHTDDMHWRGNGDKSGFEAMTWNYDKNGNKLNDTQREDIITKDALLAENKILKATGVKVKSISFPYGAYDKVALSAYKSLGYEIAYSTKDGLNTFGNHNLIKVKRIGSNSNLTPSKLIEKLDSNYIKSLKSKKLNKDIQTKIIHHQDKVTVSAWSENDKNKRQTTVKHFTFEVYQNINGKYELVENIKPVSKKTIHIKPKVYFDLENNNKYIVKVTMTRVNETKEIEFVKLF